MAHAPITRFNNYADAQLADYYGHAKAILDGATAEVDAIKAEIKARNIGALIGADFTVTLTEQIQGRADLALIKAHLGDLYTRFEKPVVSTVIRVKALKAASALRAICDAA